MESEYVRKQWEIFLQMPVAAEHFEFFGQRKRNNGDILALIKSHGFYYAVIFHNGIIIEKINITMPEFK